MRRRGLVCGILLGALLGSCSPDDSGPHPNDTSAYFKKSNDNDKVIVFIHGVLGNHQGTWTNSQTGSSWPDLIKDDPDLAGFNVFTVGYFSPPIGRASNIEELATRIVDQLDRKGIFEEHGEVFFIAHSMGGLITKRMLVGINTPLQSEKLRQVKSVFFFSTPSQGAKVADLAVWLSKNPQFGDMRPADLNTFLQGLENQWQALLRERERLEEKYPIAFCAYETQGTGPATVVNRLYAATRCDEAPYPIDLDHFELVKPVSREADSYDWVKARLLREGEASSVSTQMRRVEFVASNEADPFAVKGKFQGTARVTSRDIRLQVKDAALSFPTAPPAGDVSYIEYVRASLACSEGEGWRPVSSSQKHLVSKSLTVGQVEQLGSFDLVIPKADRADLSRCWLSFDIAIKNDPSDPDAGFSHVQTRRDLF